MTGFLFGFAFWALVTYSARKAADRLAADARAALALLSASTARLAQADEELRRREAAVTEQQRAVDRATVAVQEMYAARGQAAGPVIDITADTVVEQVASLFDRSGEARKRLS